MAGIFLLLGFLFTIYVVAPTIALSCAIRLALGWYGSRTYAALGLLFALPQVLLILLGVLGSPLFAGNQIMLNVALGLSAVAAFFWLRAAFPASKRYLWLEAVVILAISVMFTASTAP
ncbi:MAG: hypothetical protein GXP05_15880 [Alphaproteobacteria bacterium]|nr:hypothetical protein [Alphaproteobacteria bacterium]